MKNTFKTHCTPVLFVIALITVIGFTMVNCDNGTTPPLILPPPVGHTHDWGNWSVTKTATCTTEGEEARVCTIDATHKETKVIAIDPTAHVWGELLEGTPPTCTETGSGTRTCTLNSAHTITGIIPIDPNAHHWGELIEGIPPTCTETGSGTRTCTLNNEHTETEIIDALGHEFGNWIQTAPPTETTDGEEKRTCSNCGEEQTRIIPLLGNLDASNFELIIPNNSEYRIIQGDMPLPDVVYIPATYNGLPVVEIGRATDLYLNGIFFNTGNVTTINIPSSITTINRYAFGYCYGLTSIIIPDSVTYIGSGAFLNCVNLISITIPSSVTFIDVDAFGGCRKLTDLNIDADNPNYASENGMILNKNKSTLIRFPSANGAVTILPSVTSIGDGAFRICTDLTSITIHSNVISIGSDAFSDCSNLSSIIVDTGNPNYSSENGILYNKEKTILIKAPGGIIGDVIIPSSITSLRFAVFHRCYKLTSITIPSSVTSIDSQTFTQSTNLVSVTFEGMIDPNRISLSAFDGNLSEVYLASGGGIGTYTTSSPTSNSSIWTKQ
jgi:hypothetical protein